MQLRLAVICFVSLVAGIYFLSNADEIFLALNTEDCGTPYSPMKEICFSAEQ